MSSPAAAPAYLRNPDDDECSGLFSESPVPKEDSKLYVTGLREKSLLILLVLMLNIYIIQTLRMTHKGMKHIQLHTRQNSKTGAETEVLRFVADHMHLGKVVTKTGYVFGSPNSDLNIHGSRVIIKGAENGSRFLLQDGECKFENVDQFFIGSEKKPFFSAKYPRFNIDERIKRISSKEIATNKNILSTNNLNHHSYHEYYIPSHILQIRSPTNKNLSVEAENIALRGMERIQMVAVNINASAEAQILLHPTDAESHVQLEAETIKFGIFPHSLPISKSPLLEASIDAYRLCVCNGHFPKLFAVAGNRECRYDGLFCK
uniref:Beta-sarcoglycan n=1 Tax=Syphacia muris TaxID=451379 RepID=A0A0N5AHM3_9BILA